MSTAKRKFKFWEFLLLLFAVSSLSAAAILYFANIPLRYYLLGWEDELTLEKVGELTEKDGSLKRRKVFDGEFVLIEAKETLYNHDSVVTGPSAKAKLVFEDGSFVDLDPNTMVKLSFETQFSLAGISRFGVIKVISGQVRGQSRTEKIILRSRDKDITINEGRTETIIVKPPIPIKVAAPKQVVKSPPPEVPEPEPEVVEVKKVAPKKITAKVKLNSPGRRLPIPKNSKIAERKVKLGFSVSPKSIKKARLVVSRGKDRVYDQDVNLKSGKASKLITIKKPGSYTWQVLNADDGREGFSSKGSFKVPAAFQGIKIREPLIGGTILKSSAFTGQHQMKFDIQLRWHAYKGADEYVLKVFKKAGAKPLLVKKTSDPSHTFNKAKLFNGKVFYSVAAQLESGFQVTSGSIPFQFDFMPPVPVLPKDKTTMTMAQLIEAENKILFTWKKTNFTELYRIEVSEDINFKNEVHYKKTRENFLVIDGLKAGRYFWRVRSFAKGVYSPPTKPRRLTIKK